MCAAPDNLISFMTIDEIRELIQLVSDTGVAELEVQRGDNRVRIRRSFGVETSVLLPSAIPAPVAAPPALAPALKTEHRERPLIHSSCSQEPHRRHLLRSCVARHAAVRACRGTRAARARCSASSNRMKLMNEIEAEISGIIESKLVLNGQPVEYGEALFAVRPV